MTGSAVPEQKAAEAEVILGVDSTSEGNAAPESTKAVPETEAAQITETTAAARETATVVVPEVAPEEANIKHEAEIDNPGVKGHPAGETGAMGKLSLKLSGCDY